MAKKDDAEKVLTIVITRNGAGMVGEYSSTIGGVKYSGQIEFKDISQIPDVCKHVAQMWQDQRRRLGLA